MILLLSKPRVSTRAQITAIIQAEGLCTAAEVCPSSPGGQSVAGVTGRSLTKALLVVGDTFVDTATCQRLSQISSYTVDGFLCCPTGDLPSPKDFVSDGE